MSNVISKRLKIINDLQEELNKIKELYEESLENDAQFQDVKMEVDKAKTEAKVKQDKILAKTSYENLRTQMKDLRQDMKENKEILSMELLDYYKENDSLLYIDNEGNEKQMKINIRLVNA